jgi:predicted O-linked N-acetylglucosamine transferase (SPINDLY family)
MAWIGYPGTTSLSAMDYLVADTCHVPEESAAYYVESILRLSPAYVCYVPPHAAPAVGPLPMSAGDPPTLGCFSNPAQINAGVAEVWAAILRRLPAARLLLKCRGLESPDLAGHFRRQFAAHGVDPARLLLEPWSPHAERLGRYHAVDVALDPFPCSGGLTTCEALWMGVPVVTCPGETFAGRHALSYLTAVGLAETVVADHRHYVDCVARLIEDPSHLARLRARLRPQMAQSPLCDGPRFAADFATRLREAWQRRCGVGT